MDDDATTACHYAPKPFLVVGCSCTACCDPQGSRALLSVAGTTAQTRSAGRAGNGGARSGLEQNAMVCRGFNGSHASINGEDKITRRTHPSPVNGKGLCLACLVASTVETRRRGGKSWQLSGRRSLSTTGSGYHYQCSRSYNGGSSQQVGGPGRKRPTGKAPTFAFLAVGGASKG